MAARFNSKRHAIRSINKVIEYAYHYDNFEIVSAREMGNFAQEVRCFSPVRQNYPPIRSNTPYPIRGWKLAVDGSAAGTTQR